MDFRFFMFRQIGFIIFNVYAKQPYDILGISPIINHPAAAAFSFSTNSNSNFARSACFLNYLAFIRIFSQFQLEFKILILR